MHKYSPHTEERRVKCDALDATKSCFYFINIMLNTVNADEKENIVQKTHFQVLSVLFLNCSLFLIDEVFGWPPNNPYGDLDFYFGLILTNLNI